MKGEMDMASEGRRGESSQGDSSAEVDEGASPLSGEHTGGAGLGQEIRHAVRSGSSWSWKSGVHSQCRPGEAPVYLWIVYDLTVHEAELPHVTILAVTCREGIFFPWRAASHP